MAPDVPALVGTPNQPAPTLPNLLRPSFNP